MINVSLGQHKEWKQGEQIASSLHTKFKTDVVLMDHENLSSLYVKEIQ